MSRSRVVLAVTGLAFFGWLGFLGYLAFFRANPVVVSRSQAMAATHFVVGEVALDPDTGLPKREVRVVADLRPKGKPLAGAIQVTNLKVARLPGGAEFKAGEEYLLPLTHLSGDDFVLTAQPASPGQDAIDPQKARPWAYPWGLDDVRRQFDRLVPKG